MPLGPDYTHQLDQIAAALSHPALPTWLIAILSAGLGFLASIAAQICQHAFGEVVSRRRMRRVIYPDVAAMYSYARHFADLEAGESWKRERLEKLFEFRGEKFARDNPTAYYNLREYPHLDVIWGALRAPLAEKDFDFNINCGLAAEIIENCVALGQIPSKFIRQYSGQRDAELLLKAARKNADDRVTRDRQARRQE